MFYIIKEMFEILDFIFGFLDFFTVQFINPFIKQDSEYFGDFFQVLILHTFTDIVAGAAKIFIVQELAKCQLSVFFKQFEFLNLLKIICFSKIQILTEAG